MSGHSFSDRYRPGGQINRSQYPIDKALRFGGAQGYLEGLRTTEDNEYWDGLSYEERMELREVFRRYRIAQIIEATSGFKP